MELFRIREHSPRHRRAVRKGLQFSPRLFQAAGAISIRKGMISSLPSSMSTQSTTLESGLNSAKLPAGPQMPNPGPMLFRQETTAERLTSTP